VLYSKWLALSTANSASSFWDEADSTCRQIFEFNVDLKAYLNQALILSYLKEAFSSSIQALPFYTPSVSGAVNVSDKRIQLVFRNYPVTTNAGCNGVFASRKLSEIRYVIVPGGVPIGPQSLGSGSRQQSLSYREIQQRFGLKD